MTQLDEAFFTSNAALACTLRTCGCLHPQNDKGEIIPCKNSYDRGALQKYRFESGICIYDGWPIEKAAEDAVANGRPGHVIYCFVKSELLETICRGFDEQNDLNKAKEGMASGRHEYPVASIDVDPFDAARICCQFARTRKILMEAWKYVRAEIVIHGDYRSEAKGERGSRITGSFKQYSLNPSKATRDHLGL